jgi:hypothetical protein
VIYETDTNLTLVYNSSVWVCITPQSASVVTDETTSSTSYTDLATPGPAVTVATGTSALVTFDCTGYNNAAPGSSSITAGTYELYANSPSGAAVQNLSRTVKVTGLTAGSNTFTAKYKSQGNTAHFYYRDITVVGIA